MTEVRGDDDVDVQDDFEYEALRPELSTRRKVGILIISILTVLLLLATVVGLWAHRQLFPDSNSSNEIVLDVPTGSSTNSIADLLEKKGVIGNAFLFKLYVRWKGAGRSRPAATGSARMRRPTTSCTRSRPARSRRRRSVSRFRPGSTCVRSPAQVVKDVPTLSVDKLNQAMTDGQTRSLFQPQGQGIEGFLFPDTYDIAEGADERTVVQTMVSQFDKVASQAGLQDAPARVGVTPYEALIVASLVEEEAKVDEDRPKIARVIYNRLTQGVPLGVDATLVLPEGRAAVRVARERPRVHLAVQHARRYRACRRRRSPT